MYYESINDKKDKDAYTLFCKSWFELFSPYSLILTPGPRNEKYYPSPVDKGIWVKRNATAGATIFYLRLAEPILFYGAFNQKRNTDIFEYSSGFTQELKEARIKAAVPESYAPAKSMPLWVGLWQSKHKRGENSNSWLGGWQYYYGANWKEQKNKARERDNYTCQRCRKTEKELSRSLDVHHKIPFRLFGLSNYKKANDLNNLISLCPICHGIIEPRNKFTEQDPIREDGVKWSELKSNSEKRTD